MELLQEKTAYIAQMVYDEMVDLTTNPYAVPIGISARHIHLTKEATERLFGKGHTLTHFKSLSQLGQFAANETLELIGPKGKIARVRVLGPERPYCQVELPLSDCRTLGITAPVKSSGDIKGSAGIILKGSAGQIELTEGVIVAERHVHMQPADAKWFCVADGDIVQMKIDGPKAGTMDQVVVRVSPSYRLDFHIDTDDSNAFMIRQGERCTLIKKCHE